VTYPRPSPLCISFPPLLNIEEIAGGSGLAVDTSTNKTTGEMTSSFSYFGQTMVQGCLALFLFFSTLSPIPKLSGYILSWLALELFPDYLD
jgi:hypothetical protein